jgi:hypothetical protein
LVRGLTRAFQPGGAAAGGHATGEHDERGCR